MTNIRKITIFTLALIVLVSLISGYFCYSMPLVAQAETDTSDMPDSSYSSYFSACQDAPQDHYMLTGANGGQAVAPCCLEKSENNQEDAIIVVGFSFENTISELALINKTTSDSSVVNYAASLDYPISPPPVEFLASVIKIE